MNDIRYTIRTLRSHPAFLVAGVLVLGLAVGVNTAIFSVINAILFKPLPVPAASELRYVYVSVRRTPPMSGVIEYRRFLELRERRDLFADVLLLASLRPQVRLAGQLDQVQGEMVSSNYFDLLGIKPFIGRGFVWAEDEAVNAPPVAVIGYDLWQARFAGDPDILGKTIDLSGARTSGAYGPWESYTIVGVLPRGFKGISNPWDATQYWVPFLRRAADHADQQRQIDPRRGTDPVRHGGSVLVRLAPGVSDEHAAAAVADFGQRLRREQIPENPEYSIALSDTRRIRLPFDPRGTIVPGRLAAAIMSVSGVLLLIAAANVAGIVLARSVARSTELAVRLTLGASRWRLRRQLLAEGLLLSAGGGALGLLVARWLVDVFIGLTPSRFVRWQISALALEIPLDWRVLLVTAVSCLLAGTFVGLVAARHALGTDLLTALNGQPAGPTPLMRGRLQRWVVIPQVCLSLVLLLVAGVLVRSMIRDELLDPGYEAGPVALLDFVAPQQAVPRNAPGELYRQQRAERLARAQRVLDEAAKIPQIAEVTVAWTNPVMTVPLPSMHTWVAPREGFKPDTRHYWTAQQEVTASYFTTLGIATLRGRGFDDHRDVAGAPPVVIVSEDLARLIWPQAEPIGQHLATHFPESPSPPQWREVVGVVRNVHVPLTDGRWSPALYVPFQQGTLGWAFTVTARGQGPPSEVFDAMKRAIAAADPQALAANPRMMKDGIAEMLYPRRVAAGVLALSGAIGLLLASIGLYGVVAYSVAQRLREIGVRMALGADRRDIMRLIVGEGVKVSAAGIGLGSVLTYAAIRVTSRLVIAIPAMDVVTSVTVPTLLGTVTLVACYLPALRAARVDPMTVLRRT
jgi:predicted permease